MAMSDVVAVFWALVGPWLYLRMALSYLPGAISDLYHNHGMRALTWRRIRSAWFSAFWAFMGVAIRKRNGPRMIALLEGRVTQGRVVNVPVMPPLGGTVLEIGPGAGYWVDVYAEFKGAKGDTKLKVYGVEPSTDSHAILRKHVKEAGLEDTYEIIPVGIESLSGYGIEPGSVDCIVSFLCLCGIPEPEKNIAELHKYLKKGGRWYAYEHVRAKSNLFMTVYQAIVNLFWPHVVNGCELCRDTETNLRRAGPWEKIDVAQPPEEPWHAVVPHMLGVLTK